MNWSDESREDTLSVGAFAAKTHLSALLDKVAQGREVVITRRGEPVARLVPVGQAERSETESVIAELRERRKGLTLGGLHWKHLRDEGRR
ncbi:MAG: type II toxin-antitoxin system prevent-host-death family antitoxin [Acidobacteria bacterium]|nr:type II toxin-antitoxin system prevent-host-death family antitoxin [Acidobacteriota bacterium]